MTAFLCNDLCSANGNVIFREGGKITPTPTASLAYSHAVYQMILKGTHSKKLLDP